MSDALSGQVKSTAAEIYEEFFLPALFLEWAPRVAEAAKLSSGQAVLDVACGTGVLGSFTWVARARIDWATAGVDPGKATAQASATPAAARTKR